MLRIITVNHQKNKVLNKNMRNQKETHKMNRPNHQRKRKREFLYLETV